MSDVAYHVSKFFKSNAPVTAMYEQAITVYYKKITQKYFTIYELT